MRYALCVEYDGTHFKGWQTQRGQRTVQQEVEAALSKVADHPVSVITAGRTDTAVHATGQVIHFDTEAVRSDIAWHLGCNRFLPHDVRIHWVKPVSTEFHARFSALKRSYRYIIYNHNVRPCVLRNHATYKHQLLNSELMQQATEYFLGEHDFSSIRAAGCQAKSPIRTIHELSVYQQDRWIWFDVTANAFLQHMVRNIAGMLMTVGYGDQKAEWVNDVIALKDRTQAGVTAQPNGLYLTQVAYTDRYELENFPPKPIFWG